MISMSSAVAINFTVPLCAPKKETLNKITAPRSEVKI